MGDDGSLAMGEQAVEVLHPHWKTLVRPAGLAIVLIALAIAGEALIPSGKNAPAERLALAAVAVVALGCFAFYPLLVWRTTRYELTTKRIRIRTGVIARNGRDIPLSRIANVSFRKTLPDRIFGCGTLVIESPGEHGETALREIPHVERVSAQMFQLVEDERLRAVPNSPGDGPGGRPVAWLPGERDPQRPAAPAACPAAVPGGQAVQSASVSDTTDTSLPDVAALRDRVEQGGAAKYHEAAAAGGKLFARDRVALVADAGSFTEDGRFANVLADGLPADGVITGTAALDGRPVAIMANDSTVKAGSWGSRTVEKIIRIIEKAIDLGIPMIYLVDSAGARITDQVEMFPGRRGAGRIFHTQVRASGVIPQACALFGPSAAGGAYIPAFCDFVAMNEGNASMYLGSPRMVEMVVSEKTTLEELGGARMHCSVSGSGHYLATSEEDALAAVRRYLSYLPSSWQSPVPDLKPPGADGDSVTGADLGRLVPGSERQVFDMRKFIRGLADPDSFFEVHALWAREVTVGFARLDGAVIGIVANNPLYKGGVLFVDSADKAARFVEICDAFGVPLLFLADVPGFMVGTAVERQGIIRHGASMISAVSRATVPKICVVVRKAYGAGLYAMAGPGFEPDATLALPTAKIAVMGADAAVNAVYAAKLARLPQDERTAETARLRAEYEQDIDIVRLASELVIDDIVQPGDLRAELTRRFAAARGKHRRAVPRRHPISPV